MNVPQEAADWLADAGLVLVPRPGQVVYTPPTTAQQAAHEARSRRDGTFHLAQYARGRDRPRSPVTSAPRFPLSSRAGGFFARRL